MVVYTGSNTKYMLNSNYTAMKVSYFEKIVDYYIAFTSIFVLTISIISTIVFLAREADLTYISQSERNQGGLKFFSFIILYSPFLPVTLYGSLDIIMLLQRYLTEKRFQHAAREDPEMAVKVLNPEALPNLGQVSYCLIDKTGTLTTGEFKIRSIVTSTRNYKLDEEEDILERGAIPARRKKEEAAKTEEREIMKHEINDLTDNDPMKMVEDSIKKYGHRPSSLDVSVDVDIVVNQEGASNYVTPNIGHIKLKEELETRLAQVQISDINDTRVFNSDAGLLPTKIHTPLDGTFDILEKPRSTKYDLIEISERMQKLADEAKFPTLSNALTNTHDKEQLIQDLKDSEERLLELAKGFALCHSARTNYQNDVYRFQSPSPEETALLKLARVLGYSFEFSNRPDNPSVYQLRINGEIKKYNILGVNDYSGTRKRTSICVQEPDHHSLDPAVLFVKGSDLSMRDRILFDRAQLDVFNTLVNENTARGLKTMVLARRVLTAQEADEYYKKYQNYKGSLKKHEEGLEQLAEEMENKLEFVGMVGVHDDARPLALDTLRTLRLAGIKCWMVTGDTLDQAVTAGHAFEFIENKEALYFIHAGEYSEVRAQIRSILHQIKLKLDKKEGRLDGASSSSTGLARSSIKSIKSTTSSRTTIVGKDKDIFKATVVVSGDAWKVILKDEYLYSNFAFICSITGTVVAHSMTPLLKKKLVLMIKRRFVGSPIVMGLGDGLNDTLMLQTADIGIEIENLMKKHPLNAGDVKIKSFKPLTSLVLVQGRNFSNKIRQSVNYIFYKSYLIGLPLFYLNWFCSFTGTAQFESMLIFLYTFVFTFFPALVLGGTDSHESDKVLQHYPALYLDNRIYRNKTLLRFSFDVFGKAAVHSAMTFYLTMYCVQHSPGHNGKSSDFEIGMLLQYFAIIAIASFDVNIFFLSLKRKLKFLLIYNRQLYVSEGRRKCILFLSS